MKQDTPPQKRFEFIQDEIDRAYVHADDDWKQEYYENAAKYLSEHHIVEGGKICAFCRRDGCPTSSQCLGSNDALAKKTRVG